MNTLAKCFTEPLNSITERPIQFAVWWLVAMGLGLAGFWLPLLLCWARSKQTHELFSALVGAGTLASFSVVILTDGLAGVYATRNAGTNPTAVDIRAFISVIALFLLVVQGAVLAAQSVILDNSKPSPAFQVGVTSLSIVLASYLYCFRFPGWEKGVEEEAARENKDVEDLTESAKGVTRDDRGVML